MLQKTREERAVILDFLPNGYPSDTRPLHMKNPVAQAFGKDHFALLELVPKKGIFLQPNDEVYIGEGKRDKIHHIVGRIPYDRLTQTAQFNLESLVKDIVKAKEQAFESFVDIKHRVRLLPDPEKAVIKRILIEIKGEDKYSIFMRM